MIYVVLHGGEVIFATTHEADMTEYLRRNRYITAVIMRRNSETMPGGYVIRTRESFGLDA